MPTITHAEARARFYRATGDHVPEDLDPTRLRAWLETQAQQAHARGRPDTAVMVDAITSKLPRVCYAVSIVFPNGLRTPEGRQLPRLMRDARAVPSFLESVLEHGPGSFDGVWLRFTKLMDARAFARRWSDRVITFKPEREAV